VKLVRLKLGNQFRSLPADFEISFSSSELVSIDPICLVGVNGSGKSNVLEALAEIFEYLDQYFLQYVNTIPNLADFATIDQFIVEYLLPIEYSTSSWFTNAMRIGNLEFAHIKIKKLSGRAPFFSEVINGESRALEIDRSSLVSLLPSRVIGYSSGQNELLSIPFKKVNFKYYHSIREEQKGSAYVGYIHPPRLSYMSYEDNALVLLCNYIMQDEADLEEIQSKTGVVSLDSFELFISTYYRKKDSIRVTPELQRFINFLKESASEILLSSNTNNRLRFVLTPELRAKFRGQFPDAASLFNGLSWLSLLNMNGIPAKRMQELLSAPDSAYMAYRPFDFEPDFKLFTIDNILVRKAGVDAAINYKTLSDGEHQFGFIIGLMSIFRLESTLFLLDEPETHFNPKWKYTYRETFKKVSGGLKSQVLLTTHDPVLISGLNKESVIVFRKPAPNLPRSFRPDKDLKGMGVDAILMSDIFGFDTAIDFPTKLELIELRELQLKRLTNQLNEGETARYNVLYEKLKDLDYAEPLNDPMYRDFLLAKESLEIYKKPFLSQEEEVERKEVARQIMTTIQQGIQE